MLKRIPEIISPDLMKYMMEMGHSDILIIADANFPAKAHAKRYLRLDGVGIPELLGAMLTFYPLDHYVEHPVKLMNHLPTEPTPEIWDSYHQILTVHNEENAFTEFALVERLDFYEQAEKAYVIVQTATQERYANIVLQKGVV